MARLAQSLDSEEARLAAGSAWPGTTPRRRIAGWWLLALWAVLSLAWAGSIAGNLYYRAARQADMSRQVEQALDPTAAPSAGAAPRERWLDVAETYVQFGYVRLIEWTVLPPLILLIAGAGGMAWLRRRSRGTAA